VTSICEYGDESLGSIKSFFQSRIALNYSRMALYRGVSKMVNWLVNFEAWVETTGTSSGRQLILEFLHECGFMYVIAEAVHIGNQLCQYGYLFPVSDSKNLVVKDDSSLYRFQVSLIIIKSELVLYPY
jgi:hypothetical protein